jgi:hypothetical protein
MAHGHAHSAEPAEPEAPAPFLASLGFGLGIIALILVVTVKLAPVGFMIAIVASACCILGLVIGVARGGFVKGAYAGIACNAVAIVLWVLMSGDVTSIAGGRSAWPSWIFF